MKNIQTTTTTAGLVLSFFLAMCATTSYPMYYPKQPLYTQFSINYATAQMKSFCEQYGPSIIQEITTCFQKCQEGCTLGLIRKLASNYQTNSKKPEQLAEANRESITSLMDTTHSNLHYENNLNLPFWLWAEKKCKNKFLKKVIQLWCIDSNNKVAKTFAELIKEN